MLPCWSADGVRPRPFARPLLVPSVGGRLQPPPGLLHPLAELGGVAHGDGGAGDDAPKVLGDAIAANTGFSIAGGGDTLAAIDQFGIADQVSYISTGGGAFLEFVEGKVLPAVAALEVRAIDARANKQD